MHNVKVFKSILRKIIAGKSAICLSFLSHKFILGQMLFTHLAGTGRCFSVR